MYRIGGLPERSMMTKTIFSLTAFVIIALCIPAPSNAQDAATPADLKPLTPQVAARLDQALAEIEIQKEDIRRIEE